MLWNLKQLLPLSYHSVYKLNDGWHYTRWQMWFGRCFNVQDRGLV